MPDEFSAHVSINNCAVGGFAAFPQEVELKHRCAVPPACSAATATGPAAAAGPPACAGARWDAPVRVSARGNRCPRVVGSPHSTAQG